METCENCGCRVYEFGCENCEEVAYMEAADLREAERQRERAEAEAYEQYLAEQIAAQETEDPR